MNDRKQLLKKNTHETLNELKILENSLVKFHIPEGFYSIGSYAEESVCIEKKAAGWIVYEAERGNQYNIKSYKNIQRACFDCISRVTESYEQEKQLKNEFKKEYKRFKILRIIESKRHRNKTYHESEAITLIKNRATAKKLN